MPITGVLFVPPLPGNISIASRLIEHLSRRFPDCEHRDFTLEYQLLSDTSSQLPGSDVSQRSFTHFFASSHDPERGYLRATRPGQPDDGSSITIAAESIEAFVGLTSTKLQPLWYPRQHLTVEEGVAVSVKNNEWIISIGDVKTASKSASSGLLRGTIIELHHALSSADDEGSEEPVAQTLFRDVLSKIFQGTGQSFDEANFIIDDTVPRNIKTRTSRPIDWGLASMYMKALRGQR